MFDTSIFLKRSRSFKIIFSKYIFIYLQLVRIRGEPCNFVKSLLILPQSFTYRNLAFWWFCGLSPVLNIEERKVCYRQKFCPNYA